MSLQPPNPSGLCMCGCGKTTPLAKKTDGRTGRVQGQHLRVCHGHRPNLAPEYVVDENGCWIWQRGKSNTGYGTAAGWSNAHRMMYERLVGPVPVGLQLDHLCRVRACVNPAHLEPVTQKVNILRGSSPWAKKAAATECVNGHPWTPENIYWRQYASGRAPTRQCKACCHDRSRRARGARRRLS